MDGSLVKVVEGPANTKQTVPTHVEVGTDHPRPRHIPTVQPEALQLTVGYVIFIFGPTQSIGLTVY